MRLRCIACDSSRVTGKPEVASISGYGRIGDHPLGTQKENRFSRLNERVGLFATGVRNHASFLSYQERRT
jgi:hypothetical protein